MKHYSGKAKSTMKEKSRRKEYDLKESSDYMMDWKAQMAAQLKEINRLDEQRRRQRRGMPLGAINVKHELKAIVIPPKSKDITE